MTEPQDPRQTLLERFENDLTLHPPETPEVAERLDLIRASFMEVGRTIIEVCPLGRDLFEALIHIEDASRWAIAAVVKNQDRLPFPDQDSAT